MVFAGAVREELKDAEAEAVRQLLARAPIGTALNQKAYDNLPASRRSGDSRE
jgi:hypothetical protein